MRHVIAIATVLAFMPIARGNEFEAQAAFALALAQASVKPVPVPVSGSVSDGHTHTCANGHTWNHAVHAGHDCPVPGCGLSQNNQDPFPRSVNLSTSFKSLTITSFESCVGGNCPVPTQQRGIFGFRRR